MKRPLTVAALLVISLVLLASDAQKPEPPKQEELLAFSQQLSYVFGLDVGTCFKNVEVEFDADAFVRGTQVTLEGKKALLTPLQETAVRKEYARKVQEKIAELNLKQAEAFLAENKNAPGVVTTASGLQYTVLKEGEGPKPKAKETVRVHYRGTLLDGMEFDSSYQQGGPVTFQLNEVIPGWREALQLMKVGSKWRLFVPPDLAYGGQGVPQARIPPNALLIFEVELLGIEK